MKDAELIAWLRGKARDLRAVFGHEKLDEAAGRLEALATPPGLPPPPVTPEREAQIRGEVAGLLPAPGVTERYRDLLTLLDWHARRAREAEMALCDALQEDGRYEAGVRAGAARALEIIRRVADAYPIRSEALAKAARAVEKECAVGPPTRPERLAARLRKLEDALRRIADDESSMAAVHGRTAREALTEDGTT